MSLPRIHGREYLEADEANSLNDYAIKSKNSASKDDLPPTDRRMRFQRDMDQIRNSGEFKRLAGKSQVFPVYVNDNFTTRITHTIRVFGGSIGICRSLGLNEDLAGSIALAHDLGHTPFGHKGEEIIDKKLREMGLKGFDHNNQSYEIAVKLGLSKEVQEGTLKHSSKCDPKTKRYKTDDDQPSLEAQVVDMKDEIDYVAHDLEDGLKSGIIHLEDVKKLKLWQKAEKVVEAEEGVVENEVKYIKACVSAMIHVLVNDLVDTSAEMLGPIKSVDDVKNARDKLIRLSDDMDGALTEAVDYLYKNLYYSPKVKGYLGIADKVMGGLFDRYQQNPDEIDNDEVMENRERYIEEQEGDEEKVNALLAKDYIATFTDRFAIKMALKHNIITQQEVDEMSQMQS